MDKGTEELLRKALEQNAYEEQDWYGVDRDRRDNVLWKYFLWALLFFILIIWIFRRYQWGLEKENERLCRLLEQGIPVLQQGIEEESLEGLIQYETEWKEFTEHQRVGRIQRAGEMFLKILQLQYRYSEREQEMETPEITTEIEQENSGVRIRIKDKGQGIDEKKIRNLFHRFNSGEQEAAGSTGIGLHLAYEIIGRHHGKMEAYNGEKGAVFEVFLPQFELKGKL